MKRNNQKLDLAALKSKAADQKAEGLKGGGYMLIYNDNGDLIGMVRY